MCWWCSPSSTRWRRDGRFTRAPVTSFDLEADFSFDRSDRNRFEFYKVGFKSAPDLSALNDGRIDRNNSFDQALNASVTGRYTTRFGDDLASTTSGFLR